MASGYLIVNIPPISGEGVKVKGLYKALVRNVKRKAPILIQNNLLGQSAVFCQKVKMNNVAGIDMIAGDRVFTVTANDNVNSEYTTLTKIATTDEYGTVRVGEAVADAAGDAPTAAEFKALLDSLRTAGLIETP